MGYELFAKVGVWVIRGLFLVTVIKYIELQVRICDLQKEMNKD